MVQIPDQTDKPIVAANDRFVFRDMTSNTDKDAALSGMAPGIAASLPDGSVPVNALAPARDVLYTFTDNSIFTVPTPGSFVTFGPNMTFTTTKANTEVEVEVVLPTIEVGATLQSQWRLIDAATSSEITLTLSATVNIGSGAYFPNGIWMKGTWQYATPGTYTINAQQSASGSSNPQYRGRRLWQVKLNRFY